MAHRTIAGAPVVLPLFLFATLHSWPVPEIIESKAVPARARGLGHGLAQRCVDPAVALKAAICPDVDDDVLPLIAANQRSGGAPPSTRGKWPRIFQAAGSLPSDH